MHTKPKEIRISKHYMLNHRFDPTNLKTIEWKQRLQYGLQIKMSDNKWRDYSFRETIVLFNTEAIAESKKQLLLKMKIVPPVAVKDNDD